MLATLYEVPMGGAQVAVFVLILFGSLAAAVGLGAVVQHTRLQHWVWNVPLFILGVWACLGLWCALYFYGQ